MKHRVRTAAVSSRRLIAAARIPAALRSTARELGWLAAHVALYPTGMSADPRLDWSTSEDGLVMAAPPGGGADPESTPILLLHGLVDNRSIFIRLRASLTRRGFGCLLAMNYPVLTADIPTAAHGLAGVVERICARTGYERIHIVAHSMGGLIGRYYVQRLEGDERVHTLVTLATPHTGTAAAKLLPYGVVRQLRPGSPVLLELAAAAPDCRTRIVSIYNDRDALVVPPSAGRLEHRDLDVRNVLVTGAGHHTLAFDRRTIAEISSALCHSDPAGHSVEPTDSRHSA